MTLPVVDLPLALSPEGDVDCFSFTVDEPGTLTVSAACEDEGACFWLTLGLFSPGASDVDDAEIEFDDGTTHFIDGVQVLAAGDHILCAYDTFDGVVEGITVSAAFAPGAPQGACVGDFTIDEDADVAALAGCTSLDGFLTITGDVTSLVGLEGLQTVAGVFAYLAPGLTSFAGLEGLEETTLAGISINFMNGLVTLDGLHNVTDVGYALTVSNNALLQDLDGLSAVTSIGGWLEVDNNDSLEDVSGLSGLSLAPDDVSVVGNPNLRELGGWSLASIGGLYEVRDNALLESAEIDGLVSVTDDFVLEDNPALTVFEFADLVVVSGDVSVNGNTALPQCVIDPVVSGWTVGGIVNSSGNSAAPCD